jgi:hypothetical protein
MGAEFQLQSFSFNYIVFVMKTNQMHYLSVIYFVNQPLHVSCMFIAHYREVLTVYVQQLAAGRIRMEFHPDPRAASQLKRITRTNRCTYTVYSEHLLMMGNKHARD